VRKLASVARNMPICRPNRILAPTRLSPLAAVTCSELGMEAESGALSHESMESTDVEVRLHGDTAVLTGITTSKGQFMGQGFTTRERATDVLARLNGRWLCVFSQLTRVASA
jgi:Domain of unknown function (DUF4440)